MLISRGRFSYGSKVAILPFPCWPERVVRRPEPGEPNYGLCLPKLSGR
ncbi:hypothetical protein FTUN_8510 [Frigoriglobus tundricola]|uniref:Uncharacterized protein n=1 Tax=Frigoriglobus tundricola TaxID=2774151 RepID=A0A6M5Z5N6_9BACT|nr:hypothetical protein FTUN_8510 [Frigoriglobus tundricola]